MYCVHLFQCLKRFYTAFDFSTFSSFYFNCFTMSSKRKRVVLLINHKLQITGHLKKGEMDSALASEFNVGKSMTTNIKKSELMLTS